MLFRSTAASIATVLAMLAAVASMLRGPRDGGPADPPAGDPAGARQQISA